jgi:Tol biopolymer transport system component
LDLQAGEPGFPAELAASSEKALIQPSWSPDGQWVTYGTAELATGNDFSTDGNAPPTRGDIWIMRADGSYPLQLTAGASAHFGSVWSPEGRVYFTSLQNGSENIWSIQPLLSQAHEGPVALDNSSDNPVPVAPVELEADTSQGG